jgi:hypothetical protein
MANPLPQDGSRLRRTLQVLERLAEKDAPSPERLCLKFLEGLREAFDAYSPATLFFANSLMPPVGQKFLLYAGFHVGRFPVGLVAKWEDHLVRGHSPILKQLRRKVRSLTTVGVAHAYTRKELVPDAKWFLSRVYIRLATGLDVSDQLVGWQHSEDFVMAVILRGTVGKVFAKGDCEALRQAIKEVCASGRLGPVFHPKRFQPRLTGQQALVRDLVMLGYTDAEIAHRTRVTVSAVEKAMAMVRELYGARSRGDVLLNFILRGGTTADLKMLFEKWGTAPRSFVEEIPPRGR